MYELESIVYRGKKRSVIVVIVRGLFFFSDPPPQILFPYFLQEGCLLCFISLSTLILLLYKMSATEGDKELSKKEQNRQAKKEKKNVEKPVDDGTPFVFTIAASRGQGPKADLARAVELVLGSGVPKIRYTISSGATPSLPTLTQNSNPSAGSLSGDVNIAKFLAHASPLYCAADSWLACQVDQWLELYTYTVLSPAYLTTLPILLETHLESRTYLVGHSFSLADLAIFIALQRLDKSVALGVNVQRWVNLITPTVP
ncbi:hypothetical protein EON65_22340, partial [archaeon]